MNLSRPEICFIKIVPHSALCYRILARADGLGQNGRCDGQRNDAALSEDKLETLEIFAENKYRNLDAKSRMRVGYADRHGVLSIKM